MNNAEHGKRTVTFYLWLAVIIAATAAIVMDSHHRQATASYRAIPSADVRQLSADYPLTPVDRDAELTRMVERGWNRIEGRR